MKTTRIFLISMMLSLLCLPIVSKADDIDLYSGLGGDAGKPNVLLILDTAANFDASATGHCTYSGESGSAAIPSLDGKLAGLEQCALYNVIRGLPVNDDPEGSARINLGIMFYNATGLASYGCTDVSSKGGCVVKELTAMNSTNKAAYLTWIKTWAMTDIKSNSESTAQTMQEAWAYYAGGTGVSGRSYSTMKPTSGCQGSVRNFVCERSGLKISSSRW